MRVGPQLPLYQLLGSGFGTTAVCIKMGQFEYRHLQGDNVKCFAASGRDAQICRPRCDGTNAARKTASYAVLGFTDEVRSVGNKIRATFDTAGGRQQLAWKFQRGHWKREIFLADAGSDN